MFEMLVCLAMFKIGDTETLEWRPRSGLHCFTGGC